MLQRQALLLEWLNRECQLAGYNFQSASGDASFRQYFRLSWQDGRSLIVMDAPPSHEDCRPFVDVTARLAATGVHVPKIHAVDLDRGFMLLEDLGEQLYLGQLKADTVDQLYDSASAALLRLQQLGDAQGLPSFDEAMLRREMSLFTDWLLEQHLQLIPTANEQRMLQQAFDRLVESALEQPQVLVHRDYHSRNLLVMSDDSGPGIIDYQDAVLGPISYDLVSLLRDCYVAWPQAQVSQWRTNFARQAEQVGLLQSQQLAQFPRWFDLMGVQRHLKAAGIFARLKHRDGKDGYLKDVPRTLQYIVAVGEQQPEMAPLGQFIAQRVLPLLNPDLAAQGAEHA